MEKSQLAQRVAILLSPEDNCHELRQSGLIDVMGRASRGLRKQISLRLDPELVEQMDVARGPQGRDDWIDGAIRTRLTGRPAVFPVNQGLIELGDPDLGSYEPIDPAGTFPSGSHDQVDITSHNFEDNAVYVQLEEHEND